MGENIESSERARYWRDKVAKFESFNGSQRKFCEVEGINYSNFRNWRIRISGKSKKTSNQIPSFIPLEIKSESKTGIDAKWVAEFLVYFLRVQQ